MKKFQTIFCINVALFSLVFFLSACSKTQSLSLDEFVTKQIRLDDRPALESVPSSIHIVQKQAIGDRTLVLTQYQAVSDDKTLWDCFLLAEISARGKSAWAMEQSGGGCSRQDQNKLPLTVATHEAAGWTGIYGAIHASDISQVIVTWDDGAVQPARIDQNTFLAAKQGDRTHLSSIQALDRHQKVIFTSP